MKREIKFRGKRVDNGQWVYGNINYLRDGVFILENDQCGIIDTPDYHHQGMGCGLEDRNITDRYEAMEHGWENAIERQGELLPLFIEVVPETVGQYTGLKDKDGKEIYEGDVVKVWHENEETDDSFWTTGVCDYSPAEFYIRGDGHSITCHFHYNNSDRIIIGNIHDNPELIK